MVAVLTLAAGWVPYNTVAREWDSELNGFGLRVNADGSKCCALKCLFEDRQRCTRSTSMAVAGLLVTTKAMVADAPKKHSPAPPMPGGGMDF